MKYSLFITISFWLITAPFCFSQKYEIGGGLGVLHYKGDLNPEFKPFMVKPGFNGFFRINLNHTISIKGNLLIGGVQGNDYKSKDPLNNQRGYQFSGGIFEIGGQIEYNFFDFRTDVGLHKYNWTPYLFLGLDQFSLNNPNYYLKKKPILYSEAQAFKPSLTIPYGLGFKFRLNKKWNLGIESGVRVLMSKKQADYFDGFGYEGNEILNIYQSSTPQPIQETIPNTYRKDLYFYTNISISYVFYYVTCPNF